MKTLHVAESTDIRAALSVVTAQFADVAHHAETGVHGGVRFEIVSETDDTCAYRQTTRIGPLRLRQEIALDKTEQNPQVNRITKGQFAGGSITFTFEELDASATRVTAVVESELPAIARPLRPVLRRNVARSLRNALAEDKVDLESGRYPAPT